MAEIKSFPNNQDVYVGAEWVMKWLHGRTSGVFGAENNLATSVVPDSMSIEVSDGIGWLSNASGDGVVFWNDSEQTSGSKLTLTHDVADSALDRIDRIVVTWETTNYVALPAISILKGTASSSPVPPALTNNNIQRQISLARVNIPAGTVSLLPSLVTDERLNPDVCGIVTESVKIDTSVMQSQFESLLLAIQNELSSIIGGTGFDPAPNRIENIIVYPGFFSEYEPEDEEEQKLDDMGYSFRASVPISGALETMFPYVTLSQPDVDASGASIVNQFKCYNGGLFMYSDSIPTNDITALTIELRKAVG